MPGPVGGDEPTPLLALLVKLKKNQKKKKKKETAKS